MRKVKVAIDTPVKVEMVVDTPPQHELGFTKLWEWSLHEDNLFSSRVNFMLVAESMLFVAFATLLTAHSPNKVILGIIAGLGIFVSGVWLWVSKLQLRLVCEPIQKKLKCVYNCKEYREIAEKRKKWWQRPHEIIGVFFPIILMVAWGGLLCAGLGAVCWLWMVLLCVVSGGFGYAVRCLWTKLCDC